MDKRRLAIDAVDLRALMGQIAGTRIALARLARTLYRMSRLPQVRRAAPWRLVRRRLEEPAARMGGRLLGLRWAEMAVRLHGSERIGDVARHRILDRLQRLDREAPHLSSHDLRQE